MDIGTVFGPSNQQANQNGQNGRGSGPINPVQDAIRILSFAVPRVVGAGSPIPQGLLGGPTALGPQLNSLLTINWLRTLMGQSGMPQPGRFGFPNETRTIVGPGAGSIGSAPLPANITPASGGRPDTEAAPPSGSPWDPNMPSGPGWDAGNFNAPAPANRPTGGAFGGQFNGPQGRF